jgi:hypothetical protein
MHRMKEEVILRILVKESLDLELLFERYEILKFQGYFLNFSAARDLFRIVFQIPGAFMKIGGLQVDTQEVQGPSCKVAKIKEFPDLIFNRKFRGPSPRWTSDIASEAARRRTAGTAPLCVEPHRGCGKMGRGRR